MLVQVELVQVFSIELWIMFVIERASGLHWIFSKAWRSLKPRDVVASTLMQMLLSMLKNFNCVSCGKNFGKKYLILFAARATLSRLGVWSKKSAGTVSIRLSRRSKAVSIVRPAKSSPYSSDVMVFLTTNTCKFLKKPGRSCGTHSLCSSRRYNCPTWLFVFSPVCVPYTAVMFLSLQNASKLETRHV